MSSETDIIVRTLSQPTCLGVNILENNQISFDIEKELGVEIVGETKVKIAIEEDEEPWEDIVDDDIDKELDEINEDYI